MPTALPVAPNRPWVAGEPPQAIQAERPGSSEATPAKQRLLPSFEEHVSAVCALLAPEEREAAAALLTGWIRTLAADTFLRTTPAEGAEFIRTLMTNAAKAQAES